MGEIACAECQRLRREYELVTQNHTRLDNRLRLAVLEDNYELMTALTQQVYRALDDRNSVYRAIKRHQATH